MRNKLWGRLFSTMLCLMLMINIVAIPSAAAATVKTIKQSTATFSCVTLNNKVKWLLGRKSTITIKNETNDPWLIQVSTKNCNTNTAEAKVQAGNSYTFVINTKFGKSGTVTLKITNSNGDPIVYSLNESGFESIIRTK